MNGGPFNLMEAIFLGASAGPEGYLQTPIFRGLGSKIGLEAEACRSLWEELLFNFDDGLKGRAGVAVRGSGRLTEALPVYFLSSGVPDGPPAVGEILSKRSTSAAS